MIVNTDTGEILDLTPLRRKPAGPKTKRINHTATRRYTRRRNLERETLFTVCFAFGMTFVFWATFAG